MSRIVQASPKDLRTANVMRRADGSITSRPKNLQAFLADYATTVPGLPSGIDSNVSSIENQLTALQQEQLAHEKTLKKADINQAIDIVNLRMNQSAGYINRLNVVRTNLSELRNSANSTVKTKANTLYTSAGNYINALQNTTSALGSAKTNLQQTLANV